jgi:ubiquinone/menaquinone biosynthesis C-methylase UbiE
MDQSKLLKEYTEANRRAWNEVMPQHQQAAKAKWDERFMQPGYVCLYEEELAALNNFGIAGKDVAHLCCNNGIELMSLKNLGARRCVGFDISDEAIAEATARAERCGIDCQFVRTDVYEIAREYDNQFDMLYISAGGLGWLPDLPLFFARAAALLRAGGSLFIDEIHPFVEMLPNDELTDTDPLRINESYFKTEPYIEVGGLDYVGKQEYAASAAQYWFVHTMSSIIMGMLSAGLAITHFSEYERDISAGHQRAQDAHAGVPLSYILIGAKGGG